MRSKKLFTNAEKQFNARNRESGAMSLDSRDAPRKLNVLQIDRNSDSVVPKIICNETGKAIQMWVVSVSKNIYSSFRMYSDETFAEFSLPPRSPPFAFNKRIPNPRQILVSCRQWHEDLEFISNDMKRPMTGCKTLQCCKTPNNRYPQMKRKSVKRHGQKQRKRMLCTTLSSDIHFHFHKRRLCN